MQTDNCIYNIKNWIVGDWYLELWLCDDAETEEFNWCVNATVDGYHSMTFKDESMIDVINKANKYCNTFKWTDIW